MCSRCMGLKFLQMVIVLVRIKHSSECMYLVAVMHVSILIVRVPIFK